MDRDMRPFSVARDLRTQVVRQARVLQETGGLVTSRVEWATCGSLPFPEAEGVLS